MGNVERKQYVDYIKAFGIILVILGHVNFANSGLKTWIYSFHMPLFFFATGLTMRKRLINWGLVDKKVKGLIVPYFLWATIYSQFSFGNLLRIAYGSYLTICSANTLSSLWFLPTMFIATMVAQLTVNKFADKLSIIHFIAIIAAVVRVLLPQIGVGYVWSADVALTAIGFVLFGYMFEQFFSDRIKCLDLTIGFIVIGLGLSFVGALNKGMDCGYVLMAMNDYGNSFLFYIGAIGGCIFVYGVSILVSQYGNKIIDKRLSYIGQNTLIIFAVQKPIIALHEQFFGSLLGNIDSYAILMVTTVNTVVLSVLICILINKYCRCLAGK